MLLLGKGSRNLVGIKNPAIDKLVDLIISAPDRQSLITRTRALDGVLLWNHYVIGSGTSEISELPIGISLAARLRRQNMA